MSIDTHETLDAQNNQTLFISIVHNFSFWKYEKLKW